MKLPIAAVPCLAILMSTGCGPHTFVVGAVPGGKRLEATIVERDEGRARRNRIAIVDVTGMILNGNRRGILSEGENPVSLLHEKLRAAAEDDRVQAVILRLNTPGGTVTASDAMYRELMRFRQRSNKPVVALLMDVAASGGYYVACGADRIVAYPTSVTASVGVILQTISLQPALWRIGVRADAIVSGPNKDAGSPLSEMTPEQRATLQALVDDFYERFVDLVRTARPGITADRFDQVVDGRIVSGDEALSLGLVDETGDLHDAWDVAKELAGVDAADLVIYHRPLRHVGSPYAAAPSGTDINFSLATFNIDGLESPAGFYYLWKPAGR